jgi:hypothetical protein
VDHFSNFHFELLLSILHCFLVFSSIGYNDLGSKGGKAIAEALKVNKSVQNIK